MILDTFYLLFASQGLKEQQKQVADLDNQIGELAKKGQQRSEKESKDLTGLRRQRQTMLQDLKDTTKQTDELGKSYTRMAEAIGGVVTAYLGLHAIKSGLVDAQRTSSSLAIQSQWLEQNATDLAAWGHAAKIAGGTVEGLQGSIKKLHDTYVEKGIPFPANPFEALQNLSRQWQNQGLTTTQKEQAGLKLGLDEGTILLLSKGSKALQKLIDQQKKLLNLTNDDTDAARKLGIAWDNMATAADGAANKINTFLTPALVKALDVATKFFQYSQKIPSAVEESALGTAWKLLKTWWTGNNQFSPSSAPAAAPAGSAPLGIRSNNPGNLMPGGREAVFPTAAAGLSAEANNLRRYGRRGWNTIDQIISHWAPPGKNNTAAFIDYVSKQTGVGKSTPLDLNDPATLQKLMNAINKFENSGINPYADEQVLGAIAAGKSAISAAGSTPFNSITTSPSSNGGKTVNLSVGDVTIHTAATDAKGISTAISDNLKASMRSVINNWDDGVLA